MSENDRGVVYSPENTKVYHINDGEGGVICNNPHLGRGKKSPIETTESEVDRRFLCEQCERRTDEYRGLDDIISNIRHICDIPTEDKPEEHLRKEEYLEVERQLNR